MANRVKFLSMACALGVVTGCGSIPGSDSDMNTNEFSENSEATLPDEIESDEAAFALSISVAERSKKGAVVVEKSIYLPLADQILPAIYPPPPEKTCAVHAGSHLINIKTAGKFQFSAQVSYPKALKIKLSKKSCKQGEMISVRAGSGFLGLAVVTNKQATLFQKEPTFVPLPQPIDKGKRAGDTQALDSLSGKVDSSEGKDIQAAVVVEDLSSVRCVNPELLEEGSASRGCIPVPNPPSHSGQCSVHAGRQNIKIHAIERLKHITGTVVPASRVISTVFISGECEFGEKLFANSNSLSKALGYGPHFEEEALPKPINPDVPVANIPASAEPGMKDAEKL